MKFDNFNHINHMPLRVYNRFVMYTNITESEGREAAREYAEQFPQNEIKQMYIMKQYIKKLGKDEVIRQVLYSMEFEYDVQYEDWDEQKKAGIHS